MSDESFFIRPVIKVSIFREILAWTKQKGSGVGDQARLTPHIDPLNHRQADPEARNL